MVARNADHISRLKGDVVAIAWLVRVDSDLVVGVLPTEVVDVIEGIERGGGVWVESLHDLVGHSTHLHTMEMKIKTRSQAAFKLNLQSRVELRGYAGAPDKDEWTLQWLSVTHEKLK